ncbi:MULTISPECIES: NAD-dependent epimerase/dehydratase family protein [unclassified Rhizobium]|uniref:NAD-dependent epimerase/dehydratase family protein n=1 Tax=unclassified Rhizobium TaxID=2613769 RepID=UPI001ADBA641|nr:MULTISPECIES: NAD-dependent epimerase/dehydratase family protein [unclassified Rhizobium]MBO9127090.1 NAD-dependent epimerase/dehydratase family protein [Rhizobium sp. 16-488-2b]MBO9177537.1 NAD-dependent epimerase/dehydratase family protein [Rhizobium sp. 16-488-2a]
MFLVTGASGFVGQGLARTLQQRGIPFRGTSRNGSGQLLAIGDIHGATDWSVALDGADVVVHLAAVNQNVVEGSPAVLAEYRSVNVEGTINLARQAAAAGARRFVFLSSIKASGEATTNGKPFRAADVPAPESDYGRTKLEAEQLLHALGNSTKMQIVVIRSPLVYGPGMRGSFQALVRLVQRGLPLPFALIDNRRSMVYLENLTDLIVTAANHPDAAGKTFMVADSKSPSTPELVRMIAAATGSSAPLLPFPPALLELAGKLTGKAELIHRLTRSLEVDISETSRRLGWTPPFEMTDALSRTLGPAKPTKD